jgi:hypothetical protein
MPPPPTRQDAQRALANRPGIRQYGQQHAGFRNAMANKPEARRAAKYISNHAGARQDMRNAGSGQRRAVAEMMMRRKAGGGGKVGQTGGGVQY